MDKYGREPDPERISGGLMALLTLVWGGMAFVAVVIGLLPIGYYLNWFTVLFAGLGLVLSLAGVVMLRPGNNAFPIAALPCNVVALVIAFLRLRGGAPL
jgi:hypothetical protein